MNKWRRDLLFLGDLRNSTTILFLVPLLLSAFTHIWNPIGFLEPENDESIYMRRVMLLLDGKGLQDPASSYYNPYFGQLFLAGTLGIIGYPNSLHSISDGNMIHYIEILWTIPRLLMGVLAVIDTFLIYKIAEIRYNRNVALITSILFAVMPITWILRPMWLDSILLPFLLSSVLFAAFYIKKYNSYDYEKEKSRKKRDNKNIISVLLSGIFLGLAVFTKIPAATMIPLIAFLIYKNNKSVKTLGLWFIPVILIPLIWPSYATYVGQLNLWFDGIYHQTHRTDEQFFESIIKNFNIDPVLLAIGAAGLLYAVIKRDFFLLLWAIPFSIFFYAIGWTQHFHFILIFPAFCIASAKLIMDLCNNVRIRNVQHILPFVIISGIGIYGLASTIIIISENYTTPYFEAAAFIARYLNNSSENDNHNNTANSTVSNKLTVISNPFYLIIPQYVLHLDNEYYGFLSIGAVKTQKVILIVDETFRDAMSFNTDAADRLLKVYKSYDKSSVATFENVTISLSDVLHPSPQIRAVNLVDENHIWKPWYDAKILQKDSKLKISVNTNNTNKIFSRAFLPMQINSTTGDPILLTLDYSSESLKGDATFLAQIRDNKGSKILWSSRLNNPNGQSTTETFFLPSDIANKPVELRLNIITQAPGEHCLTIKNMSIA